MGEGPAADVLVSDRAIDARGTKGSDRATRGTAYRRERNFLGGIEELRAYEQFRALGFDIGSAALTATMQADLSKIVQYIKLRDDVNYRVIITGTASDSRIQRLDPYLLGKARADAVADYMVTRGIPRTAIVSLSHSTVGAPSSSSAPEVKAEWRGAFIDVQFSGVSRRPDPKVRVPVQLPDPNRDISNLEILKPPMSYKDIPKKAKEVASFIQKLNASASTLVYRNSFNDGWSRGLALLTEAEPSKRSLGEFAKLPEINISELEKIRLQAVHDPVGSSRRVSEFKSVGMKQAFEQIRALGPNAYEQYAKNARARFPIFEQRRLNYLERASRGQYEL